MNTHSISYTVLKLTEGVPKVGTLKLLQGPLVMQMPDHLHILAAAAVARAATSGATIRRRQH